MKIADIDPKMLQIITKNVSEKVSQAAHNSNKDIEEICEGERHSRLVSICGALSRQGLSLESLTKALININNTSCKPALQEFEVRSIAQSIHKYKNFERNPALHKNKPINKITRLLFSNKGNSNERNTQIASLIIKDLEQKGIFIKTDLDEFYYFDNSQKELLSLKKEKNNYKKLMMRYKINFKMPAYDFIYHAITVHCYENGTKTSVYKYAHYDKYKNILYIKCGKNQILKIDLNSVTKCDNGIDGVLFSDLIDVEEFEYIENLDNNDYINNLMISLCNFNEVALDSATQKILAKAYFIALFMPEFMNTKPILTIVGTKGSAKTTLLKAFTKVLYGEKHNVALMPNKPDDLDILVANSHFLGIDNLDTHKEGLNDKLAVYATGGLIKKRKLYTDSEVYEADLNAYIGISTRALCFKRDDILQRLILLELSPITGGFIDENELMKPLLQYRNNILTQAINEIQKIMRIINSHKYKNYRSAFRMADFANFFTCLLDDYKVAESHLKIMTKHQREVSIDNDLIIIHLARFTNIAEHKFYSAYDIYNIIIEHARPHLEKIYIKSDFEKSYETVLAFAKRLNNIKDDIQEFIKIETKKGRANQTLYSFSKGERFEEINAIAGYIKVIGCNDCPF